MPKWDDDVVTLSSGDEVDMKPDPDEKLMMEQMGFSKFTAKWQTELEEKEVEVKEERPTFRWDVFISDHLLHMKPVEIYRSLYH